MAMANHNEAPLVASQKKGGTRGSCKHLSCCCQYTIIFSPWGGGPPFDTGELAKRAEFLELGPVGTSRGDDLMLLICSWKEM